MRKSRIASGSLLHNESQPEHYCPSDALSVLNIETHLTVQTSPLIWRPLTMQIEEELLVVKNEPNTRGWQFAVASSILGWVLDAFDFFVVVFLLDALAANFHVEKKAIVWTISITLAMRPVGALLFGALAVRFGRKKPSMACVFFSSPI